MPSEKRYFWLKLHKDFFNSKRIKKLRKLAGGDTYTIIYLKMQLLSLTKGGVLEYTGLENTFAEEIALDIDEDVDNVAVTLQFLTSCGLIETSDEIEYFLPYVVDNIGSETSDAQRMREKRKKDKNEQLPNNVRTNFEICYGEIDIEKDKEIDIEKEIEKKHSFSTSSNIGNYLYILSNGYPRTDEIKRNTIIDESITEWLEYKDAKKPRSANHYDTEAGLTKLINKFLDMSNQYGTDAVVKVVNDSMGNNYQGITWDRLPQLYKKQEQSFVDKWKNA